MAAFTGVKLDPPKFQTEISLISFDEKTGMGRFRVTYRPGVTVTTKVKGTSLERIFQNIQANALRYEKLSLEELKKEIIGGLGKKTFFSSRETKHGGQKVMPCKFESTGNRLRPVVSNGSPYFSLTKEQAQEARESAARVRERLLNPDKRPSPSHSRPQPVSFSVQQNNSHASSSRSALSSSSSAAAPLSSVQPDLDDAEDSV